MYLERDQKRNRLYCIWIQARFRARGNKNQTSYLKRGEMLFQEEWNDYLVFREWALANGYKETLSLDRIDNALGYTIENCKWSTRSEQQYNQHKKTITNATSTFKGVSLDKRRGKFRSRIYINKKETMLGYFDSEIEAAKAYDDKVLELGLNIPKNIMALT